MIYFMPTKPSKTYCRKTIQLVKGLVLGVLELAGRLKKIRDGELWAAEGYGGFDEFLLEAEIRPATASKYITIYEKLVLEYKFPCGKLAEAKEWTKLYLVASRAKTKAEAEQLLLEARTLTSRDLELKTKGEGECGHDFYALRVCRLCGLKEKIHNAADN
jgi:hypothetical protein